MRRIVVSLSALAGLGVLLGGILLWRKVGTPSYVTTKPYDRPYPAPGSPFALPPDAPAIPEYDERGIRPW